MSDLGVLIEPLSKGISRRGFNNDVVKMQLNKVQWQGLLY